MTHIKLPAYESALQAFHDAFRPELEDAISRYPNLEGASILDIPCGDGFYSALFAKRMLGGEIVAADRSSAYLRVARRSLRANAHGPTIKVVKADAYQLPFENESFDLIWFAQSMISLDDPQKALREMRRVLKDGGKLAVLETDEYHHVLLPWPVSLELAIQRCLRSASKARYASAGKFAQARRVRSLILEAGLIPTRKRTIAADRQVPFDRMARRFLVEHFSFLRKLIRRELPVKQREAFDRFTATSGKESFLHRSDGEFTCLASLFHARRPAT